METTHAHANITADMSAPANSELLVSLTRTEKNRRYKAAQRARQKASGVTTLTIELTEEETKAFRAMQAAQRGPIEDFAKRALLTGAKFVANSGNTRGGKKKIRTLGDAIELRDGVTHSNESSALDCGTHREDTANSQNT